MNTEQKRSKNARAQLPDAALRRSDPQYLRELLAAANLSQRSAARFIGVDERTMRNYAAGKGEMPYAVQYCLEVLASDGGAQVADVSRPLSWHSETVRRITRADVGKILLGRNPGGYVVGVVKADEWGIVIEPLPGRSGVDGGKVPANTLRDYVLIDAPAA